MIPSTKVRSVSSGGVMTQGVFGISDKDQAHILVILRDRLYTNKVLAVLREYGSNAWDEHRDAGIPDRPIKVALPTRLVPSLVIRDYGRGLSESDIMNVYVKYGASTKREDDVAVGMLGIGAKSAFAYADSFTISSFHKGTKSIYVAVLDESDVGVINKLGEAPCGDETGVEIKIQVDPSDIWHFQREAAALFPFFNPQPIINLELPKLELDKNSAGFMVNQHVEGLDKWIAVMGCVPYRIDFTSVSDAVKKAGLSGFVNAAQGGLFFDIGDVDVAANREGLEYTEDTQHGIVERLSDLRDEIIRDVAKSVDDVSLSHWERRLKVLRLMTARGLQGLADLAKGYGTSTVTIIPSDVKEAPKEFRLRHLKSPGYRERKWTLESTRTAQVDSETRFIIRDNTKNSRGYHESSNDRFVLPINGIQDAEDELKKVLEKSKLTGVTVVRQSALTYVPFSVSRGSYKPSNSKYNKRTFLLREDTNYFNWSSDDWHVSTEPLEKDDVFVILRKFKPSGRYFLSRVVELRQLAEFFDEPVPKFFGLRSTDTKPIYEDDVDAIKFNDWYDTYIDDLLRIPRAEYLARATSWGNGIGSHGNTDLLEKELGRKHPISKFLAKDRKTRKALRSVEGLPLGNLWNRLKKREKLPESHDVGREAVKAIRENYPLMKINNHTNNLSHITGDNQVAWIQYVKLIDEQRRKST